MKVTRHKDYNLYKEMKKRCRQKSSKCYKNYGGRGIKVCDRWNNFKNFNKDMGDRPSPDMSIDRIDNDGDYCPENCRWATRKQQSRNTRKSRYITYKGQRKCIAYWAEKMGLKWTTIRRRIEMGWSVSDALEKPVMKKSRG